MNIRLSNNEKLSLISSLATMLGSGISILEAADSMLEEVKGGQKQILVQLKQDLSEGKSISESFSKSPDAFDSIEVNLIKAAEESGTLESTLKDLAKNIQKDIEFSEKVKNAALYPLFVIATFVGVLLMILLFVMPRIASVFSRLKVKLPLPTRVLIFVSNALIGHWQIFLIVILIGVSVFALLYRFQKRKLLNLIYMLPVINVLSREVDLTRFTRSMGLLLSSGIPITEALELSKNVVKKQEIYRIIEEAETAISSGKPLSECLKNYKKIIPGIMLRTVETGEKSGKLEQGMQELADFFDNRVTSNFRNFIALLEPVLLVIIGFFVGGIMLSIIAPIYNLIGQIQSR